MKVIMLEMPPLAGLKGTVSFILPEIARVSNAVMVQLQILPEWGAYDAEIDEVMFYEPYETSEATSPFFKVPLAELRSRLIISTSTELDDELIDSLALYCDRAIANARLCEQCKEEAIRDPLTRLLNKEAWKEQLHKEIYRGKRQDNGFSVLFFDLDNFKEINDKYGHIKGDEILQDVAKKLRQTCRGYDLIGRFGGDEFVILFPETNAKMAHLVAKRIRNILHESVKVETKNAGVYISYGIASFPTDGKHTKDLITVADKRMYEFKNKNKDKENDEIIEGGM